MGLGAVGGEEFSHIGNDLATSILEGVIDVHGRRAAEVASNPEAGGAGGRSTVAMVPSETRGPGSVS